LCGLYSRAGFGDCLSARRPAAALLDDRGATIWGLGRGCWLSASAGR